MNQGVVDSLERRYRRLLVAYPVAYREERAEEIIATLLSAPEPGRHMPSVGEVLDLVSNGLRTRVRLYRRAGADLAATAAFHHAGIVTLVVAAAAAIAVAVGVGMLGETVFPPGGRGYPWPVRIGVGIVLAAFPAALVAELTGRCRRAWWLAAVGALGTIGFAVLLVAYALRTHDIGVFQPTRHHEHLEPSNLFGLVVLLCLPAVLLRGAAAQEDRDRATPTRRWAALAVSLTAAFVFSVGGARILAEIDPWPGDYAVNGRGSLLDTFLTQAVAAALAAVGVWNLRMAFLKRENPRPAIVAWAMSTPLLGYAFGTLLTPILFRPEQGRQVDLAPNLLEVTAALAVILAFARLAIAPFGLEHGMRQSAPRAD